MPVYEYTCESCGKTTEALRRIADADESLTCEHCHSDKTHRAHSVFAAGGAARDQSLPMSGCGRCGDPRGSCQM